METRKERRTGSEDKPFDEEGVESTADFLSQLIQGLGT